MSSDVKLFIHDSQLGAVVAEAWIGGRGVLQAIRDRVAAERLAEPHCPGSGVEVWGRIRPDLVAEIAHAHYVDGLTPEEVREFQQTYPPSWRYTWTLWHDF